MKTTALVLANVICLEFGFLYLRNHYEASEIYFRDHYKAPEAYILKRCAQRVEVCSLSMQVGAINVVNSQDCKRI
jgi:hypothetical protein